MQSGSAPGRRGELWLALAAVVLAAVGVVGLAGWDDGVVREHAAPEGVPVEVFRAAGANGPRPVVVVAHGFAGSTPLMYAFGPALAQAGYAVVFLDFAGHGANPEPLPGDWRSGGAQDALQNDLDAVVAWSTRQPWAAPGAVALLGHSMGAGAVTRYAASDPAVRATVAVSLPSADDLPTKAARPANLLLLVGAREQPRFTDAALAGLQVAYPDGGWERTYGDAARGTARRAQQIAGVEHVGIVFAPETLRATESWLDASLAYDGGDGFGQRPRDRMVWAGLLLLATTLGLVPLASFVLGGRPAAVPSTAVPGVRALLGIGLAAVAAGVALAVLPGLADLVPLAVGGYVAASLALVGAFAVLLAGWWRRPAGEAGESGQGPSTPRALLGSLALAAYLAGAFLLVADATWAEGGLVGARRWWAAALAGCAFAYFLGEELMVRRARRGARLALSLAARAIVLAGIVGAVLVMGAPGFVLLIVPLMAALFAWFAVVGHSVAGRAGQPWAPALVQAAVTGAALAAVFPLLSR